MVIAALATALILGSGVPLPSSAAYAAKSHGNDPRLAKAYRFERGQWIYVHLEGSPPDLGYQHGYLLAPEIADAFNAVKYLDTYRTKRDWSFYRETAEKVLWPHIDEEYRQELQGIVDGLKAKAVQMDLWDLVALNAFEEVPDYYVPWLDKQQKRAGAPKLVSPGNCSAFVATGSWTRDHQPVIAHNNWTNVSNGARWRIIFDIVPQHGYRMLMDGFPGLITSNDDFGVNSDGLMITETTITQFEGFDPNGKPEFMRSRKAMQYASSIDDYARIMREGNNGGYANDWLLADRKTGEVAQLELGLKHTRLWRTKDGYFVGSNFASDPALIKDEASSFDPNDKSTSPNARHVRWEQLMAQYKGKIDATLAERFISDHYDTFDKKEEADERTLCGHGEDSPRGIAIWDWDPYYPGGAVQGKVMDASMAKDMRLIARRGHPCGKDFLKDGFLKQHEQYMWQEPALVDMKAGPWTEFKVSDH